MQSESKEFILTVLTELLKKALMRANGIALQVAHFRRHI